MEDLINVGVGLVAQNPRGALVVSAIPAVQGFAWFLSVLLPWLGTIRGKGPALPTLAKWSERVAAFPVRLPASPAATAKPEGA